MSEGWGDDMQREDMWYSFSKRKATAEKCTRFTWSSFTTLPLLDVGKPNCLVCFLHTHHTNIHNTLHQTLPPRVGEEQMSKTQTKERSPAERHAYLRAVLVQAQKLVPPPVPKQAYRHFTMKKSHSPCGKCTQIGNTHSLPHTYLLSTSPTLNLPSFTLSVNGRASPTPTAPELEETQGSRAFSFHVPVQQYHPSQGQKREPSSDWDSC